MEAVSPAYQELLPGALTQREKPPDPGVSGSVLLPLMKYEHSCFSIKYNGPGTSTSCL